MLSSQDKKKRKMLYDAGLYSFASVLTQAITLVAGILTRRFLGPVQMGVWALLQVILTYSSYSTLGAIEAIHREIPFYQGKGDRKRAEEIKNLVFSFSLLTASAVSAALILYAVLRRESLSPAIFYGLLFMSLLVVLQRHSNLLISLVRCYKDFSLASRHMVLSAVVNGILIAFLTAFYKMHGFLWAMSLSFLFNIIYLSGHYRFSFRWTIEWGKIRELIRYGFPIMIVGLVGTLFLTIDKLMIVRMIGFHDLGVYSVALLAYSYIGNIPNALGNVLIPNFHEKYGESEKPAALQGYVSRAAQVFSDIMPVLISAVWFIVPYFVRWLLPDFEGSTAPMRWLALSAYFLALSHPYNFFIVVIRKQLVLLPIIGTACFLAFVFNYFAIKGGWGIEGVAWATTGAIFVKFTAIYFYASGFLGGRGMALRHYGVLLSKFLYMLTVLFLIQRFFETHASLLGSLFSEVLFLAAYAPFLIKLNRDLHLVSLISERFKKPAKEAVPAQVLD